MAATVAADGRLLGGRYELLDPVGYGGMAEVFRGRDVRLSRDVAIKVLRADLARDPSFQSRFRREAQAAASLNHPNVVAVYDTGEDGGVPFIVMEYVEGRTLREVLAEEGRLLPRRALEIAAEVAGALEYSHRAGIIHRDIKPGNVMLTRTGDVKVMDFGIARAVTANTATMEATAAVLGTAQYISPEQARGEHVDARTDIYSSGCLLYELLTGVPPFTGESAVAVAYQHVREDPVPPSQVDPDLPPALDAVVLKAMAKNPANRYPTAAAWQADLERAAAGRRVEATPLLGAPVGVPVAAATEVLLRPDDPRRDGRRRAAYGLLAAAVLAVFVIAALLARSLFSSTSSGLLTPDLTGKTLPQAEAVLANEGLHAGTVTQRYYGVDGNPQKTAGVVYDQSPVGQVAINKGGAVDLFVSQGVQQVKVPSDLIGKSLQAATAELNAQRLTVGTVTQSSQTGPPGTVLAVDPAPGTTLLAGATVNLSVYGDTQQVPNVINAPLDQATQALTAAGFQVSAQSVPGTAATGTVLRTNPGPGAAEKVGTVITVYYSDGKQTPTPTPSPTPTDSATTGSASPSASASPTPSKTSPAPVTTASTP